MAEAVKVDRLKLVVENAYDFLLRQVRKKSVMFITSWGTSRIISSSSITIFLGEGAIVAAAAAATCASDSLTISFR